MDRNFSTHVTLQRTRLKISASFTRGWRIEFETPLLASLTIHYTLVNSVQEVSATNPDQKPHRTPPAPGQKSRLHLSRGEDGFALALSHVPQIQTRPLSVGNTPITGAHVHKPAALAACIRCFLRGRSSCSAIHALRRDIKVSIKRDRRVRLGN